MILQVLFGLLYYNFFIPANNEPMNVTNFSSFDSNNKSCVFCENTVWVIEEVVSLPNVTISDIVRLIEKVCGRIHTPQGKECDIIIKDIDDIIKNITKGFSPGKICYDLGFCRKTENKIDLPNAPVQLIIHHSMSKFIEQIISTSNYDSSTGLYRVVDKEALNNYIIEASKRVEKPKRAPNAFIIFKGKLNIDKSEVSGRGTLAKIAKERWDDLSITERDEYLKEWLELRKTQLSLISSYNEFFSISNEKEINRKRGRPKKNKEENNTGKEIFKHNGETYLWDKSNDEVFNTDGDFIGYKTNNGFTTI